RIARDVRDVLDRGRVRRRRPHEAVQACLGSGRLGPREPRLILREVLRGSGLRGAQLQLHQRAVGRTARRGRGFHGYVSRGLSMSEHQKGVVIALAPEDGESFWQPLPSTGYVINKINPYNAPYDSFSTGLQILEPGAHIRRHAHERSHELLFCYRGTGQADIDGELYDVLPETM